MTILLIMPEESRTKFDFAGVIENECLELEYISTLLKNEGPNVILFDCHIEKKSVNAYMKEINPDVVYICGRTFQENFMLEYAKNAKNLDNSPLVLIGGIHVQLNYEKFYKPFIDYIFTTFDIYQLIPVINHELFNVEISLNEIPGLCYKDKDVWKKNDGAPFDIKKLPRPDRSYFYAHKDNYRYLALTHAAWVRTAYSCPYNCMFCIRNRMNMSTYSSRDIDDVVDEIAEIQTENIYIVDDDFLFDEKRLYRFIELIKEKNLNKKFICYGRSDFIATHEELMKELKEIGFYYVLVGLEAIDDSELSDYNKHNNIQNNIKSIEICNRLGINIMGMFILDLKFTGKDFKNMYKWILNHNLKHVALSIFTPEPGMETYDMYKDRIITDNPSHFDYLHLVAKPEKISVRKYYFHYYWMLLKLFIRANKDGIYDFLDYGYYIKNIISGFFFKRSGDDE